MIATMLKKFKAWNKYIDMRWEKGDFRNIACEEINCKTNENIQNITASPKSEDAPLTVDKTKTLSTATTANKFDKNNSSKSSYLWGMKLDNLSILNKIQQNETIEENTNTDLEEMNETAYSPPLARQLFSSMNWLTFEDLGSSKANTFIQNDEKSVETYNPVEISIESQYHSKESFIQSS